MSLDPNAPTILYVDDEVANLLSVQYALEGSLRIEVASSADEALARMEREPIAVLLTDQRMPGMSGVELCERVRARFPDTVRIILTAYADVHAAIDAVNRGQVLRYLTKPIGNAELEEVLRAAIEAYQATQTMRELQQRAVRATPARALTRNLNLQLAGPLRRLRASLQHAADLMVALEHAPEERRKVLLEELRRTRGDAEVEVRTLEAMSARLDAELPIAAEPKPTIDLVRATDGVVRLFRRRLVPTARLSLATEGNPRARIATDAFARALDEVLSNAITAVADRGDIEVRVSEAHGFAVVRVRDDGPGIPEEARTRVFDPGFSLSGRAGLGLARARDILEQHGGTLSLERDAKTCFALHLPLADDVEEGSGEFVRSRAG
ncbi:MAG: response regulator [Myxococcales bacterium]|nr:response regulator [Myxococcales bacterium]